MCILHTKQKKINKERKHKSLSPEKRLANTLAQSMSSISKSFEKLDLVGHHRRYGKSRSREPRNQGEADQHNHKKQRRRSRPLDQVKLLYLFGKKGCQIFFRFNTTKKIQYLLIIESESVYRTQKLNVLNLNQDLKYDFES